MSLKILFDSMIAEMGYMPAYLIVMTVINLLGFAYYRYLIKPLITHYKGQ